MEAKEALQLFEDFLKKKSLRVTEPRKEVLTQAWQTHSHFTAEQMYDWVKGSGGRASRATVYRTLGLLVEGGFLAAIERGQGQVLYEHILGHRHHDHMICMGCSTIIEFRNQQIETLQQEEAKRFNFHMVHHTLTLEGYCASCWEKYRPELDD